MTIEIKAWPTPEALLANLGAVDEVQGCIIHGMANTWLRQPKAFRPGTPLLTAVEDGETVAAAVQASVGKVVFSLGASAAILALAGWWDAAGKRPESAVIPESARADLLNHWTGWPILETTLYKIETAPEPPSTPGMLRRARNDESGWLVEWTTIFNHEAHLPEDPTPSRIVEAKLAAGHLFIWEDVVPRAMLALAGPTPRSVRINGVYTPDHERRRGYASAAVSTLTRMELQAGRKVVQLFADRDLEHTNRMYQRIGFERVADFVDLALSQPRPTQSPIA